MYNSHMQYHDPTSTDQNENLYIRIQALVGVNRMDKMNWVVLNSTSNDALASVNGVE